MRAYTKEILLTLIAITAAAYLVKTYRNKIHPETQAQTQTQNVTKTCEPKYQDIETDEWITAKLPSRSVRVLTTWRECGVKIEREMIVAFKASTTVTPRLRIVAAAAGDMFRLEQAPHKQFWYINVNDEPFQEILTPPTNGSSRQEIRYHFGSAAPPALRLYEQAHEGMLDATSVVLLSAKSPGELDSGTLGVVNIADIVGVIK